MTGPISPPTRPATTRLLAEIRELVVAWRRSREDDDAPGRRLAAKSDGPLLAAGDGLVARFAQLDDTLTAATGYLPTPWAQATAEVAPLPDDAPPPLQAAAAEVEAALAAYRAAEAAKTTAMSGLDDAGKALGDARLRFLELARRADLERP